MPAHGWSVDILRGIPGKYCRKPSGCPQNFRFAEFHNHAVIATKRARRDGNSIIHHQNTSRCGKEIGRHAGGVTPARRINHPVSISSLIKYTIFPFAASGATTSSNSAGFSDGRMSSGQPRKVGRCRSSNNFAGGVAIFDPPAFGLFRRYSAETYSESARCPVDNALCLNQPTADMQKIECNITIGQNCAGHISSAAFY